MMEPVIASLQTLSRGSALSAAEVERAVGWILEGDASEAVTAAFTG